MFAGYRQNRHHINRRLGLANNDGWEENIRLSNPLEDAINAYDEVDFLHREMMENSVLRRFSEYGGREGPPNRREAYTLTRNIARRYGEETAVLWRQYMISQRQWSQRLESIQAAGLRMNNELA
jgi:hypothetical protein